MGFEIMIEVEAGGTSSKLSQLDEDGKVGAQIGGPGSFNASNVDAYFGDARRVAWWIEHKDVGRLTVGRYESAGVVQTIDLGGIGVVASSSFILMNGSFFIRGPTGQYYATSWANIGDPGCGSGPYRARALRQPELARLHLLGVDRGRPATTGAACCGTPASSPASASPRASATSGPETAHTSDRRQSTRRSNLSAHRLTFRLGAAACR